MKKWIADLHIHTLLSPCAAIEMTPRHIMMQAAKLGVGLVAITDHNVSANTVAAVRAGQNYGITVWPGVEVETKEGGHLLVLFDSLKKINLFQQFLDLHLPALKNNAEKFGGQFVVDEQDEFIREEERLLLTSSQADLKTVVQEADSLGGLCIAAHVDRPAYSLLSYLGFFSPDILLAAVELSRNNLPELEAQKYKLLVNGLPYLTSSDAHTMEEFLSGPKNKICMQEPTIKEFKLALQNLDGRFVEAGHLL